MFKDVKKREHSCAVSGNANWSSIMENNMEVPQKIKDRTIWSSNSIPGCLCEENGNSCLGR